MGYSDFKYYKPTMLDKFTIEGCGWVSLILLFAGVWISEFRWRLIFSSLILFLIAMLEASVLHDKEKKAKSDAEHAVSETEDKK